MVLHLLLNSHHRQSRESTHIIFFVFIIPVLNHLSDNDFCGFPGFNAIAELVHFVVRGPFWPNSNDRTSI